MTPASNDPPNDAADDNSRSKAEGGNRNDKDNKKRIGAEGEALVAAYLTGLGWRILCLNFQCREGEIDVIAEEPGEQETTLVFVEVKTRRGTRHGLPIESVDARKAAKLLRLAGAYFGQRRADSETGQSKGGRKRKGTEPEATGSEDARSGAYDVEPACRFDIAEVQTDPQGLSRITLHRGVLGL